MSSEVSAIPGANSRRSFPMRAIVLLSRLPVAAIVLYAGAAKAIHPGQLMVDIQRYQLVSDRLAWLGAGYLPYLEILSGVALLIPRTEQTARFILVGLLLVFVGALISAWARGLNITCGCFGGGLAEKPNYPWWLMRDLGLLALLVAPWLMLPTKSAFGWLPKARASSRPTTR